MDTGQRADDGGDVLVDPDQGIQTDQLDLEPVVIGIDTENTSLRAFGDDADDVVGQAGPGADVHGDGHSDGERH